MMKPKIIQNETEYQEALVHLEHLMENASTSQEEDELELFSLLIEKYEEEHFPIAYPDPIAAIEFRMDQQGLTRKDMQKYLGSQSKVSEVLSGKRPLSLAMIRKLNQELGIPAEVLLQDDKKELQSEDQYRWNDFPFNEMVKMGYFQHFSGSLPDAKEYAEELLVDLFSVFKGSLPQPVYCKRTDRPMNENALLAWQAYALSLVRYEKLPEFDKEALDEDLLRNLVHLSFYESGPKLVKEHLNKKGIHFLILKHLSGTHLDGATFLTADGRPVIALTLRYDRVDNFWFTLMHELGHVYLHLKDTSIAFFDETEQTSQISESPEEKEANEFARNALVSSSYWSSEIEQHAAMISKTEIIMHANELEISPSILAGRVRWETGNYRKHSDLIGRNQIREKFPEYQVNCE